MILGCRDIDPDARCCVSCHQEDEAGYPGAMVQFDRLDVAPGKRPRARARPPTSDDWLIEVCCRVAEDMSRPIPRDLVAAGIRRWRRRVFGHPS